MARKDPILDTVEKRVKEDPMEAQRLEDLLESYVVKDVVKETMTSISWRCTTKRPNLHVVKTHLGKTPMALQVAIFRVDHLVKYLRRTSKNLTLHEFQQCFPHPLVIKKDKTYCKFLARAVPRESSTSEVNFNDDIDDFLSPIDISQSWTVTSRKE
jgi:uncharacterized protein (DUF2132 family)